MKSLSTLAFIIAGTFAGLSPAIAQSSADSAAKKAPVKKAATQKNEAKTADEDEKEPEIAGMTSTAFDCELGSKITIYRNAEDDQQIALQWNKRLHRMTRVGTTTGANRFENTKKGLVWIGIPAKGMLLDSKKGQQLANECKSAEQMAQKGG